MARKYMAGMTTKSTRTFVCFSDSWIRYWFGL